MKAYWSVVALGLFFCFGLYVSVFKTKNIYEYSPTKVEAANTAVSRDPAAIKRTYDFSGLDGSALAYAAKQRLLNGVKIVHNNKDVGLELGHFVIRGEDGQKTFACQKYDKIILSFISDGSAVNGELPQMEVEGACEISSDINSISAVFIPVEKILSEPVADGEFNFNEGKHISIHFANVSDQWPKLWQLRNVRLFDSQKVSEVLEVSTQELKEISGKPITISW